MPVTARLSRAFYERFGDDLVNELVEWFNQVDATYKADLRQVNDLNFARFDAKLEQRVGELHAKIDQRIAELKGDLIVAFEKRFADYTRWLVTAWLTVLLGIVGQVVALFLVRLR